jgi:hypothetical protein
MERVDTLIKRLLELSESHAGTSAMLVTAQMLVHELEGSNKDASTGTKVSVIHPGKKSAVPQAEITVAAERHQIEEKAAITAQPPVLKPIEKQEQKIETTRAYIPIPKIEEIPTFAYQQKESLDLNDKISSSEQTLNERLKTEKKELGNLLKESPVKDLKKAIGINDRFVFIEELFRGDENMYERSIKTINSFSIFPEAEYWIQRELKTKIGWDEESATVQHFDQLVRRRFS